MGGTWGTFSLGPYTLLRCAGHPTNKDTYKWDFKWEMNKFSMIGDSTLMQSQKIYDQSKTKFETFF